MTCDLAVGLLISITCKRHMGDGNEALRPSLITVSGSKAVLYICSETENVGACNPAA